MITYNDFQEINRENEEEVMAFVRKAIHEHIGSELYQTALIAEDYDRHLNRTIMDYQKLLYTITGKAIVDEFNANYKLPSRFFNRFITQENQYLLGNGVTWKEESTGDKLGENFDYMLQKAGKYALVGGVSFGFFNLDHMDVFKITEFKPLYDEENGAMMAGIRFWQIDESKPLRATLYEIDGYTDYIWFTKDRNYKDSWDIIIDGQGMKPKRPYKLKMKTSEADGTEIYDGENYPDFPIVPLWGNPYHQSELIGMREQIDCYDLIKSGFANTVDEGSIIYWLVQNAGGMDDMDLAKFVDRIKTMHAASVGEQTGEAKAEAKVIEPPYQSREALLDRLRSDLYEDAMALDTKNIADGAVTATQIQAAYDPLNGKVDEYEYCVIDFLTDILKVAGIQGESPTFTRSMIINRSEEMQNVIMAADYTDDEYTTRKLLTLMGDGDMADEILERREMAEADRNGFDEEVEEGEEEMEGDFDVDSEMDALLAELG